jgi:hypothetical protein
MWAAKHAMRESADLVTWSTLRSTGREITATEFGNLLSAEMATRRILLQEILGLIPFHPVRIDPLWKTSTVVGVAAAIYEERRFAETTILADALEDAGCDSNDILAHLRSAGPHVRGCWAVDLILDKS